MMSTRVTPTVCTAECDYKMRPAFLFTFRRTDCGCDARRHHRHPAASTLRGASVTDKPGKRMPAFQRDRPAVEI